MSDYICRPAKPADMRFVIKSWLDCFRASKTAGLLSLDPLARTCECGAPIRLDYHAVMGPTVERLIQRSEVIVAANPRGVSPYDLHGYIVFERNAVVPFYEPPNYELQLKQTELPLVHFVMVKKLYRGLGIARALFKAAKVDPLKPFIYSCSTPISVQIDRARKIPLAEWNPLPARFEKVTSKIHDEEGSPTPVQLARAHADSR